MSKPLRNTPKPRISKTSTSAGAPGRFIWILMAFLVGIIAVLLVLLINNRAASISSVEADLGNLGEVVSHEAVEGSSMTAWLIKLKDTGEQALFYTTKDGKTMAAGTLWDTKTGNPITTKLQEQFVTQGADIATAESPQSGDEPDLTPGQAIGKWDQEIPEVFNVLDKLGGFKEDPSVSPADTVYMIYDPRCPYCDELFRVTRDVDLKAKGVTIKWLPAIALGMTDANDPVVGQAAYGLQAKTIEDFALTFTAPKGAKPTVDNITDEQAAALDANLSLLHEASNRTFGEDAPKSVPAAFYLDKRNGQPRMVYGPQQASLLISIFGE